MSTDTVTAILVEQGNTLNRWLVDIRKADDG